MFFLYCSEGESRVFVEIVCAPGVLVGTREWKISCANLI